MRKDVNKKQFTKFEQIGFVAVAIVVLSFVYVKKIYEPYHKKFEKIEKRYVQLVEEINQFRLEHGPVADLKSIAALRGKELEKEVKTFESIEKSVAGTPSERTGVLAAVSELAKNNNLIIKKMGSIGEEGPFGKKEKILDQRYQKIELVCGFSDFRMFLKGLNGLQKLVGVEYVNIERSKERQDRRNHRTGDDISSGPGNRYLEVKWILSLVRSKTRRYSQILLPQELLVCMCDHPGTNSGKEGHNADVRSCATMRVWGSIPPTSNFILTLCSTGI